ncbi:deoxynucleoside kinase [Spiroplasma endosymbiont of Aspidapion aeneum]|uniref:deoxynucleoside kinase n=1 Tax=Spiroplasma endosymbiont of Aspidapion aeneum TaxID=3066276 RepID=UPI00313B96F0
MNIAVFGTVGAGKSTFCDILKEKLKYTLFREPLDHNPYFEDYYREMEKYCFQMQVFMLTNRVESLFEYSKWDNTIFDRSIIEDPIFVRVQRRLNIFSERDFKTYYDFYNKVIMKILNEKLKIDKIIYLKVTTETAIRRINERGRKSEIDTPNEYWDVLNDEYDKLYCDLKNKYEFIVIDANTDDLDTKINQAIKNL